MNELENQYGHKLDNFISSALIDKLCDKNSDPRFLFFKTLSEHLQQIIKEMFDEQFVNDRFAAEHEIIEYYERTFKKEMKSKSNSFIFK